MEHGGQCGGSLSAQRKAGRAVVGHKGGDELALEENHVHVVLAALQTRHHHQAAAVTQTHSRVVQLAA